MSQMQYNIWQEINAIGRGVWFTAPVLARRVGCQAITAKRHLEALKNDGYLEHQSTLYNNRFPQTLYILPELKGWDARHE